MYDVIKFGYSLSCPADEGEQEGSGTVSGKAAVFLRPDGANGFGHVGWGYQLPNNLWMVGSVENPYGGVEQPAGHTGYWYHQVQDPEAAMQAPDHFGALPGTPSYGEGKVFEVLNPNPERAWGKVVEWQSREFLLAGGNCLNCAYDVLVAFGAVGLPTPSEDWLPNQWFGAINGQPAPA